MRVQIVFPTLPPATDGIGDYTARLAAELAGGGDEVAVLTGRDERGGAADPIPGVAVLPLFSRDTRSSVRAVVDHVARTRPDWLLLQYNPFSYGRWGLNLSVPAVLEAVRRGAAGTRVAVMVHEAYVPIDRPKFAVMAAWQRWQFRRIGRSAHVLLLSMARFVDDFAGRFPQARLVHSPVGSNLPRAPVDPATARAALGIEPDACVLGMFGTAHGSRLFDWVAASARRLTESGRRVVVVYTGTGPDHTRNQLAGLHVIADGPLPAPAASARLAASDVYVAPFVDGVSSRRGSFIAGLSHGLATVSTVGYNTDPFLRQSAGDAFLAADLGDREGFVRHVSELAADAGRRRRLGDAAIRLHDHWFAWPQIARRVRAALVGSG